jgi:hypothetical protein
MKHRDRPLEQDDLLRPRLVDLIDMRHELVKLAALIDWEFFEREWAGFFPSGTGRPATGEVVMNEIQRPARIGPAEDGVLAEDAEHLVKSAKAAAADLQADCEARRARLKSGIESECREMKAGVSSLLELLGKAEAIVSMGLRALDRDSSG